MLDEQGHGFQMLEPDQDEQKIICFEELQMMEIGSGSCLSKDEQKNGNFWLKVFVYRRTREIFG